MSLLASGCSDPKAARELGVSERTLRRRVNSAMNALGTRPGSSSAWQSPEPGSSEKTSPSQSREPDAENGMHIECE